MSKMISDRSKELLALSFIKGVGSKTLTNMAIHRGGPADSLSASLHEMSKRKLKDIDLDSAYKLAEEQIHEAQKRNHRILTLMDDEYPASLKASVSRPPILFCAGNLNLLNRKSISIIGTREPSKHGKIIAERLTKWFSEKGWVITSGLAHGIDTVSHEECLNAGGQTIAVLAHGLEKIYPAKNANLAERIVREGGLLISEYKYNSYVAKSNFVQRDSIQAGLSHGVLLVQSGLTGGSLHASRAALKDKRYLLAAAQSRTDENIKFEKSKANFVLLGNDEQNIAELLQVNIDSLKYLIKLKKSSDLELAQKKLESINFENINSLF